MCASPMRKLCEFARSLASAFYQWSMNAAGVVREADIQGVSDGDGSMKAEAAWNGKKR